jgi:uncharacterized protein YebE (UPF0316 family)
MATNLQPAPRSRKLTWIYTSTPPIRLDAVVIDLCLTWMSVCLCVSTYRRSNRCTNLHGTFYVSMSPTNLHGTFYVSMPPTNLHGTFYVSMSPTNLHGTFYVRMPPTNLHGTFYVSMSPTNLHGTFYVRMPPTYLHGTFYVSMSPTNLHGTFYVSMSPTNLHGTFYVSMSPTYLHGTFYVRTLLRQRTDIQTEVLDASFSTWSVQYQRKVWDKFFPELMRFCFWVVSNVADVSKTRASYIFRTEE